MMNKVARIALASVMLAAGPAALAIDPIPADARLVLDPAIQTGTLANGLRYAIAVNNIPADAVSVRLVIHAGSYDEEEGERGFAHFVEHMAFRATRSAPDGIFDNRLGAVGVALGRDQNAGTGLTHTVYKVDFPRKDSKAFGEVLGWMRDAADGILFTPASVDAERSVVLAELRTRSGAPLEAAEQLQRFQAPGLRSSDRNPGGTPASVSAAKAEGLAAFHRRWYRPDNAAVIVTGAVDPVQVKAMLESAFGSWKAEGPKPQRAAAPAVFPARPVEALTIASAAMPNMVTACRVAPLDIEFKPSVERVRRETLSALWSHILSARLAQHANRTGSGLLGAMAIVGRSSPDSKAACLMGMPVDGKWKEAVALLQGELSRLAKDGPTESEVEASSQQIRIQLDSEHIGGGDRKTPAIADEIVEADVSGSVIEERSKRSETLDTVLASVEPADVKQAIAADWTGSGPAIAVVAPQPIDRQQLLAAWSDSEKAKPLAAYADAEAVEWPYVDFGKKGKIARRLPAPVPGVERVVFKNGVTLSSRKTDTTEPVEIRVFFGHGERGLSPALRHPAAVAGGLLPIGGLGKLDYEGVRRAIGHDSWVFNLQPHTDSWVMSASAYPHNVEQQLQVLAAFLTDPAFGPLLDDKIPTAVDIGYRMGAAEPTVAARRAIDGKFFPDRMAFPPRESLDRIRAADLAAVLKPALTGAPIEVTVVGNVPEKLVRQMVGRTFGALPPRAALGTPPGDGPFRHYGAERPGTLTAFHSGPADKAAVMVNWPLWVGTPERRSEEYALMLVSSVFEHRLLQRLRVKMGKTYGPSVSVEMPDRADQGTLGVTVDGAPAEALEMVKVIRAVAAELAEGGVSQEEVDRAREPLMAQIDQRLATNSAWADVVGLSFRNPDVFNELIGFNAHMKSLTLDDVRRAASVWLKQEPVVGLGLPEPAASAARPMATTSPGPGGR